jgi:hypothetical protein
MTRRRKEIAMRAMSQRASAILETLTAGLLPLDHPEAECRRVGEKGGAFMQLVVERLGERNFSVAHYFEQNGDAMRDPEMLFHKHANGLWYATYFRQDSTGTEQESAVAREDGAFTCYRNMQADHTRFANQWMANIALQQTVALRELRREARAAAPPVLAKTTGPTSAQGVR